MVGLRYDAKGDKALKKYLTTIMTHFKQVKVVHHLPGRMRLYVPFLDRVSSEWRRYQSDLIEIIKVHKGIVDIEMSIITGRILIHYDPDRTNKSQILRWFRDLALTIYEGYSKAPFESEQQIPPFLKKMRAQSRLLMQDRCYVRENM